MPGNFLFPLPFFLSLFSLLMKGKKKKKMLNLSFFSFFFFFSPKNNGKRSKLFTVIFPGTWWATSPSFFERMGRRLRR